MFVEGWKNRVLEGVDEGVFVLGGDVGLLKGEGGGGVFVGVMGGVYEGGGLLGVGG